MAIDWSDDLASATCHDISWRSLREFYGLDDKTFEHVCRLLKTQLWDLDAEIAPAQVLAGDVNTTTGHQHKVNFLLRSLLTSRWSSKFRGDNIAVELRPEQEPELWARRVLRVNNLFAEKIIPRLRKGYHKLAAQKEKRQDKLEKAAALATVFSKKKQEELDARVAARRRQTLSGRSAAAISDSSDSRSRRAEGRVNKRTHSGIYVAVAPGSVVEAPATLAEEQAHHHASSSSFQGSTQSTWPCIRSSPETHSISQHDDHHNRLSAPSRGSSLISRSQTSADIPVDSQDASQSLSGERFHASPSTSTLLSSLSPPNPEDYSNRWLYIFFEIIDANTMKLLTYLGPSRFLDMTTSGRPITLAKLQKLCQEDSSQPIERVMLSFLRKGQSIPIYDDTHLTGLLNSFNILGPTEVRLLARYDIVPESLSMVPMVPSQGEGALVGDLGREGTVAVPTRPVMALPIWLTPCHDPSRSSHMADRM